MTTYTPEQIEANRRAWIAALRNGDYRQGRMWMRTNAGCHCCLGVADAIGPRAGPSFGRYGGGEIEKENLEVCAWLGIDFSQQTVFINMNDTEQIDFSQIADRAEAIFFREAVAP